MMRLVCGFNLMVVGMNAANIGTRERACVCFVGAGLKALGSPDEGYMVVNLPISGMSRCCLKQLVGVDSVGSVSTHG